MNIFPKNSSKIKEKFCKTFHRWNAGSINFSHKKSIVFCVEQTLELADLFVIEMILIKNSKQKATLWTGFPSILCHYLRLITFFLKQIRRFRKGENVVNILNKGRTNNNDWGWNNKKNFLSERNRKRIPWQGRQAATPLFTSCNSEISRNILNVWLL